jgi:hypothetical protein
LLTILAIWYLLVTLYLFLLDDPLEDENKDF